jgi:hypothetical protein
MFEELITAENVDKLKNLGLKWVYHTHHPEDPELGIHFNYKTIWVYYDSVWYRYSQLNLGSLIYDFLPCKNSRDIKLKIEFLLKERKMEVFQ